MSGINLQLQSVEIPWGTDWKNLARALYTYRINIQAQSILMPWEADLYERLRLRNAIQCVQVFNEARCIAPRHPHHTSVSRLPLEILRGCLVPFF